ncbi:hypothetical protein GCM10009795_045410 [Nocardioides hankookensis]|uniref:Uncharacterized protein n=1 Tax=Nocardioides hankookensis TaxID=443157 RepID=A0ABW1LRF5_9ACTN
MSPRYLGADGPLLGDMQTTTDRRRAWRTLSLAEKQHRLAGLRQRQQQQVARDVRVLTDLAHGATTPR